MNNFKFLSGKSDWGILTIAPQPRLENVEFCFQFDEEEPIPFANGTNELHIYVSPTTDGNITFTDNNGKKFKIFARERI